MMHGRELDPTRIEEGWPLGDLCRTAASSKCGGPWLSPASLSTDLLRSLPSRPWADSAGVGGH